MSLHPRSPPMRSARGAGLGPHDHSHAPRPQPVRHAPGDLHDNAVKANVDLMVRRLRKRSSIINEAVATGKVKVVGSVYDLDTGLVNLNTR